MPHFSVRSAGLFAFAVVIAWHSAPTGSQTARAGCGEYVHVGHGEFSPEMNFPAGDSAADQGSHGRTQSPAHPGCHGPSCGQKPLPPFTPAPLPVPQTFDQKACLEAQVDASPAASGRWPVETSVAADDCPARQIERPPRFGS